MPQISIHFYGMTVTSAKVIAMLEFEDATNELELRVCSYLTTMIGNIGVHELILFLRFVELVRELSLKLRLN